MRKLGTNESPRSSAQYLSLYSFFYMSPVQVLAVAAFPSLTCQHSADLKIQVSGNQFHGVNMAIACGRPLISQHRALDTKKKDAPSDAQLGGPQESSASICQAKVFGTLAGLVAFSKGRWFENSISGVQEAALHFALFRALCHCIYILYLLYSHFVP